MLDYGIGNLRSAQKTLEHVGADARLTADPAAVAAADGVVLPGVGSFGRVLEAIRDHGVDQLALDAAASGRPFLGICVGMQALYDSSSESPGVTGLSVLSGHVGELPAGVKRPQMQWNRLDLVRESPLFSGIAAGEWVYFVHSYAPPSTDDVVATCDYGGEVVAAVERGSVYATQFHPEKSGAVGVRLMANFVALCRPGSGSAS